MKRRAYRGAIHQRAVHRIRLATMLIVLALSPMPALAQIPVTDVAAIVRQIANHIETLRQWQQQFQEWQRQYDALNGNWEDLLAGYLGDALADEMRATFPPELDAFMREGGGIAGTLLADVDLIRATLTRLPPGYFPAGSALAGNIELMLGKIARHQAAADNTYRSAQRNLVNAGTLRGQVGEADTVQRAGQLTARINAEILAVQIEANRLLSLQMRMEAEREREALHHREQMLDALARPVQLP